MQPSSGRPAENVDSLTVALVSKQIADYKSNSSTLAEAAGVYRRIGDERKAQRVQRDSERMLSEVQRLESFLQGFTHRVGGHLTQASGARRHWLTPVLADLDEILRDVDGRWGVLAQLVRELEQKPQYSAEKVRLRVTDYRRRRDRK